MRRLWREMVWGQPRISSLPGFRCDPSGVRRLAPLKRGRPFPALKAGPSPSCEPSMGTPLLTSPNRSEKRDYPLRPREYEHYVKSRLFVGSRKSTAGRFQKSQSQGYRGMSLEEPCEISGDPSGRSAVPAQPRISPARAGSEARRAEFRELESRAPRETPVERAGDFTQRAKGISPNHKDCEPRCPIIASFRDSHRDPEWCIADTWACAPHRSFGHVG
jgi:hypothetical protein